MANYSEGSKYDGLHPFHRIKKPDLFEDKRIYDKGFLRTREPDSNLESTKVDLLSLLTPTTQIVAVPAPANTEVAPPLSADDARTAAEIIGRMTRATKKIDYRSILLQKPHFYDLVEAAKEDREPLYDADAVRFAGELSMSVSATIGTTNERLEIGLGVHDGFLGISNSYIPRGQTTFVYETRGQVFDATGAQLALKDTLEYLSQRPAGPVTN